MNIEAMRCYPGCAEICLLCRCYKLRIHLNKAAFVLLQFALTAPYFGVIK